MGPNAPLFYQQPLVIARGKGVWLHDAAGRRYLDAYNNVPHVGHCHPAVVKAVQRQMSRLNTHTRYLDAAVLDYHERLLDKFPRRLNRVVLTCTGSEANDLALRIARQQTGHQGVIVTDWTYHGNSTAVAEISSAYNPAPTPPHVRLVRAPQADGGAASGLCLREPSLADAGRVGPDLLWIQPRQCGHQLPSCRAGCTASAQRIGSSSLAGAAK